MNFQHNMRTIQKIRRILYNLVECDCPRKAEELIVADSHLAENDIEESADILATTPLDEDEDYPETIIIGPFDTEEACS